MINNKDRLKPFFIVIFILILVSILINIGSQVYLSQNRIETLLGSKLKKNDKLQLKFKKAQISFSGSLSPFFAIKLSELDVTYSGCSEVYRLTTPYILVPISVFDALNNKLKIGYIKAGDVELSIKEPMAPCSDSNESANSILAKFNSIKSEKNFENVFGQVQSIFKSIKGFRVLRLNATENKSKVIRKLTTKNLRVSYNKKEKTIHTYMEVDFEPDNFKKPADLISKKGINLKIKSTTSYEDGFSFQATARHLEGVFEVQSKPQKTINDYKIKAIVKDLPLTFFNYVSEVKQLNLINSQRVWFNADLTFTLKNFFNPEESTVVTNFTNLEVYGPVLRAYASNFIVQIYPNFKILNEIEWRIDSLNLNGLVAKDNLAKLRGVIDQFGEVRGAGKISLDGEVSFEGIIKDSTFAFSMNGKKAQQVLSQANLNLLYKRPSINLNLEKLILVNGLFDGTIDGHILLGDDLSWDLKANAEKFRLSKKIQKLYAIKQTPFEKVDLLIQGKNRELISLSLTSKLETLMTKWGDFKKSNYSLNYDPDKKVYKFDLLSKSFILNPQFLQIDILNDFKNLKQFSTSLELSGEDKSFHLLSKTLSPPLIKLLAEGQDFNKDFMVSLSLGKTNFVLQGQINSGFKIRSVD